MVLSPTYSSLQVASQGKFYLNICATSSLGCRQKTLQSDFLMPVIWIENACTSSSSQPMQMAYQQMPQPGYVQPLPHELPMQGQPLPHEVQIHPHSYSQIPPHPVAHEMHLQNQMPPHEMQMQGHPHHHDIPQYIQVNFEWFHGWLLQKWRGWLPVTYLSLQNNLPMFRLKAPVVIRVITFLFIHVYAGKRLCVKVLVLLCKRQSTYCWKANSWTNSLLLKPSPIQYMCDKHIAPFVVWSCLVINDLTRILYDLMWD